MMDADSAEGEKVLEVLLIEDSKTVRGILLKIFKKISPNCIVHEAEEGHQALRTMTQRRIDLIVTDLQMPGMDGVSFLRRLQGIPLLAKKPVLVLSSAITYEKKAEFVGFKTIKFLKKPAAQETIAEAIAALLEETTEANTL